MDAKSIADKYIAPDGSPPVKGGVYVKTIIKELSDQGKLDALSCVAFFIAYHDKNDMWGGHKASHAWSCLCCILDIPDDDEFYNVVRSNQPNEVK